MEKKKGKLNIIPPLTPPNLGGKEEYHAFQREGQIRVAIAMSGGVDSSVAAKILVDQGYKVVGFMMKLWSDPTCPSKCPRENACCDDQGVMDAKKVADLLGIPFYLVNAKEIFKKEVADYFIEEYKNLRTPNPCVVCNEKIKFGWLLDFAKKTGCDFLATGHYARIAIESPITKKQSPVNNQSSNYNIQSTSDMSFRPREMVGEILSKDPSATLGMTEEIVYHLLKGKDEKKDQSYFLYRLNQDQLSKIIFPVGEYTKDEVRAMAKKWKLPVYKKRESQEICFIQDKDFREFLKRNIPAEYFKPGDIVDKKGNVLGKHDGLINYTIGQRKGINQLSVISNQLSVENRKAEAKNSKQPLYVVGFNKEKNQLIVGEDCETYMDKMTLKDMHFVQNSESRIMNNGKLQVKIRYRHPAVNCKIKNTDNSKQITVEFMEKQRAITPGQSAVFYLPRAHSMNSGQASSKGDGEEVLGGGIMQ